MTSLVVLFLRAISAAILVAAGAAKLADLASFTQTLVELGLPKHPTWFVRGCAYLLPLVELGLGLMLLSGLWPSLIDLAALFLFAGFSVVVLFAQRFAPHVSCRCFGSLSDSQFGRGRGGMIRSLLLTLGAAIVWWYRDLAGLQVQGAIGLLAVLVVGYILFAFAAAQAARTLAIVQERREG